VQSRQLLEGWYREAKPDVGRRREGERVSGAPDVQANGRRRRRGSQATLAFMARRPGQARFEVRGGARQRAVLCSNSVCRTHCTSGRRVDGREELSGNGRESATHKGSKFPFLCHGTATSVLPVSTATLGSSTLRKGDGRDTPHKIRKELPAEHSWPRRAWGRPPIAATDSQ
jgi:hypothetical protein